MGNVGMLGLAVFAGGGVGAVLRWLLSMKLNSGDAAFQLGTLAANLSGAFVIGLAIAFFRARLDWGPELRLFCVTGLLGGLTTFSSFSMEVVALLEKNHLGAALAAIGANLGGSLLLTALGLAVGGYAVK
ncbi:MAG: fluoride efflux transporter CrcB [Candidatus Adiutrix sp.]|jgi:CrcB protein|nr:fluoride efflux transporter CrcB [Candidatus Adiutrix sp.]